jgi:folylpolyglutamate synthase/dihydropteroate synthase
LIARLIVTRAQSPRAAHPAAIADAATSLGLAYDVQPAVATALDRALHQQSAPLLVTGSLFVAGEAREALGLAAPDRDWEALNTQARRPAIDG